MADLNENGDEAKNNSSLNPLTPLTPVDWFLKGDKFLHEISLSKRDTRWGIGACLYAFLFVMNEFIWHFTPYTGKRALIFLQMTTLSPFFASYIVILVTRHILFGVNKTRPDPAKFLPNRIAVRTDYQNVIPLVGEKRWLTRRIAAYVDLFCSFVIDIVIGWQFALIISMPYFLLQK
jgi:hypothetical protein